MQARFRPRLAAAVALIAWAALIVQLCLSLRMSLDNGRGFVMGLAIYLGFFTILSNLLAALALTLPPLRPRTALGRFFGRPGVNTAIAAYLLIVGIAYAALLRRTWNPQGMQLIVDHLLHDGMPLMFLAWWWLAVPKHTLAFADIPYWLLFPVVYFATTLTRGALTGIYPYPFVDAGKLGLVQATTNALCVLVLLFVVAAILIGLGRLQLRRERRGLA